MNTNATYKLLKPTKFFLAAVFVLLMVGVGSVSATEKVNSTNYSEAFLPTVSAHPVTNPVLSAPVFGKTLSVFARIAPVFGKIAPVSVETAPVFARTAPVFIETAPVFARTPPVFVETAPIFGETVYPGISRDRRDIRLTVSNSPPDKLLFSVKGWIIHFI